MGGGNLVSQAAALASAQSNQPQKPQKQVAPPPVGTPDSVTYQSQAQTAEDRLRRMQGQGSGLFNDATTLGGAGQTLGVT